MSVRHRPVTLASADERVSREAVMEAIVSIMEARNPGGAVDRALASRVAGEVQGAVALAVGSGRISSSAHLVGQQTFWSILSQHLASTNSPYMDQQAQQNLLERARHGANVTSAEFATFVTQFLKGGGSPDRSRAEREGGTPTSARFDGFSGADAPFLGRMRDVAIRHGLHWAADRPEILRMGEEAIRLFARTGFTRESFDGLRSVGFQGRHIATLVQRAEESGQNPNDVAKTTRDTFQILGGNNPQTRAELLRAHEAFMAAPGNPQATAEWDRLMRHYGTHGSADQQAQVKRQQEVDERIKQAAAQTAEATARATQEAAQRAAREREEREARERRAAEAAERVAKEQAEAAARAERQRSGADVAGLDALLAGATTPAPAPGVGTPSPVPAPGTGTPLPPAVVTQPAPPTPTAAPPPGQQAQAAPTPTAPPTLGRG